MYSRKRISHSKQGEPFLFAHTARPRPEIMPPKERLTVTEHLAKHGADAAFYANTEEGASIICKPLPYCRLRGDTRQKVLEYWTRSSNTPVYFLPFVGRCSWTTSPSWHGPRR